MMCRALMALLVALAATAAAARPARVVSINLCADQLLTALADPAQIAGLSPLARDPHLSFVADRAGALPVHRGTAEELVTMHADLVLVGPFDNRWLRAFIASKGVPVLTLGHWASVAQGRAEIRSLAAALGQEARGEALIQAIDSALAEAQQSAVAGQTVLMVHRRGYVSGADGIAGDVARQIGLTDIAPALGVAQGGFVPLEKLVAAKPDFIIVSDAKAQAEDQGTALLQHKALVTLYPPQKRLVLPDRLTICGGPATPALIRTLASELKSKTH